MLATCTGAKAGASWITTRPPEARSMTRRSSAGIVFHALAGAALTMSVGVGSLVGGAAPIKAAAAVTNNNERICIPSPFARLAEHSRHRYRGSDVHRHLDASRLRRAGARIHH